MIPPPSKFATNIFAKKSFPPYGSPPSIFKQKIIKQKLIYMFITYRYDLSFYFKGIVQDDNCWEHAENKRQDKKIKTCNDDPCPAHWWIGPWQLCPATCQKLGEPEPIRRRSIMCVDQNEMALPDSQCEEERRPKDTDSCAIPLCNTTEDVEDLSEEDNETTSEDQSNVSGAKFISDYRDDDADNHIKKIKIAPYNHRHHPHVDDNDFEDDEDSLENISGMSNTI